MAAVNFRNATTLQGNANAGVAQNITLPTILSGDTMLLWIGWIDSLTTVTLGGVGSWFQQPLSTISGQLDLGLWTTVSLDGSESGGTTTLTFSITTKYAVIATSYSGVAYGAAAFGNSTPTYAQNLTSNTTSATPPSITPVPNSWGLSVYSSKSTTNASYTTPAGLTSRAQVFGAGGGAVDLALFDSNGPTSAVGGSTSTMGTATANKIAGSLVLNDKLVVPRMYGQAVKRAAYF